MQIKMGEIIERGEYSAQMLAESPGNAEAQLWKNQYLRFQKDSAEQNAEAARTNALRTRTSEVVVPQGAKDKLMLLMQENQGNPDEQRRILNEWRKNVPIPPELIVPIRELGAPL